MNAIDPVSSSFLQALQEGEWPENVHFILGVSGGVDSMALAHLFKTCTSHRTTWAHVNFGLRGEDSDGDALFVEQVGEQYGVQVQVHTPSTQSHAKAHGWSTQMAARDLRYQFFNLIEQTLRNEGFVPVLVTAHHADDQTETILQNLIRGKHPLSWAGMLGQRTRAFRPLLNIRKSDLLDYAKEHGIAYSNDASNSSDYYQRNFIRHRIIPLLEELNAGAAKHINDAGMEASRWLELAESGGKLLLASCGDHSPDGDVWPLSALRESACGLAFELHCSSLGFQDLPAIRAQIKNPRTGAWLTSTSHELLFDRDRVILREKKRDAHSTENPDGAPQPNTEKIINTKPAARNAEHKIWESAEALTEENTIKMGEEEWEVTRVTQSELTSPELGQIACIFDADKLEFPVILRKWQPGDRITPLGLGGMQKVKDILINRKISRFEKEQTWVLADKRNVACILFHTLSERIKVTSASVRIVQIRRR